MADDPYYEQGGRVYARTTRVLDILRNPGLEAWQDRLGAAEADKVRRRAAKIGTTVDRAITARLNGTKVVAPKAPDTARAWSAWQQWHAAQVDFVPSRWQQTLYNDEHGYAGTPDVIEDGAVGGVNRISDWKVAASISQMYIIQLHAYVPLAWPGWKAMDDIKLRIVRIDPFIGVVEPRPIQFNPRIIETFLKLLDVYNDWFLQPELQRRAEEDAIYVNDD